MIKFREGHEACKTVIDGRTYDIDFEQSVQINQLTGKERKIRCFFDLPNHWNVMDEDALRLLKDAGTISVEPMQRVTDPKLLSRLGMVLNGSLVRHDGTHCNCWHGTSTFVVIEAWQIKNLHLWRRYQRFVRSIEDKQKVHRISPDQISPAVSEELTDFAKSIDVDLAGNQRLLFHGTGDFEVAKSIATEGFDNRVSNGGLYGRGTYFAAQTCKSAQYATADGLAKASPQMLGTMLIARVAVGDPYYAQSGLTVSRAFAKSWPDFNCLYRLQFKINTI